jgi:tetratricopeptide (TPR) repeat protein
MKKIWRVGDIAHVSGDWDRYFKIRNKVEDKKSLAHLCQDSGFENEAIRYLNSAINKLREEISKNNNSVKAEIALSINLPLLMISIYSDLADIYYKKSDMVKLNETLSSLSKMDDKNYESHENQILGLMAERINRLESAVKFYEKASYGSCWHAFRIACILGHKDFGIKMLEKYINGIFTGISYDVWGEWEVNKSAFTVHLLENENDYKQKIFESNPDSILAYLVYGKLLEDVGRHSDALDLYRNFLSVFSKIEEQNRIINESKELNTATTFFDSMSDQMKQTGKFSNEMWDILISYFSKRARECEYKILV